MCRAPRPSSHPSSSHPCRARRLSRDLRPSRARPLFLRASSLGAQDPIRQPYQGQSYQGQPYQGQPYQGQPYQGQYQANGQYGQYDQYGQNGQYDQNGQYGAGAPGVPPYGSPYAQWTPPPKPGLIPLMPMGFGRLLMAPFQVLRRNPRPTFGSALLVQFVVTVLSATLVGFVTYFAVLRIDGAQAQDSGVVTAGSIGMIVLASLVTVVVTGMASALLQGVLSVEVARSTLGEKQTMRFLWRSAFSRFWPLVGWFGILMLAFIVVAAILIGAIVFASQFGGVAVGITVLIVLLVCAGVAVLWAWLGTKFALVPVIIVLERLGIVAAAKRSWALTAGNFWRTFGAIYLTALIISIAGQVISAPISLVSGFLPALFDPLNSDPTAGIVIAILVGLVVLIVTLVIAAISSVIQSAIVAVVYVDLRMRREGLDLELIRYVEARDSGAAGDLPDPFSAAARQPQQQPWQPEYQQPWPGN